MTSDASLVVDALTDLPEEERYWRMLVAAWHHRPLHGAVSCIECGHDWPCFTFVALTGIGEQSQ